MATAGAAKKRDRGANFLDLGVAGRRTGVTLKDTGIRDEYGLEPIDGIFSSPAKSPEKSPTRGNGAAKNSTITTEEEMEIGNSTAPEPTDVLTERRRTLIPPPRSRSPIKTFLGSPAKRGSSIGRISSPFRKINEGKRSGAAKAIVNRKLDFSAIGKAPLIAKPSQNSGSEDSDQSPLSDIMGATMSNLKASIGLQPRTDGSGDGLDFLQQTEVKSTHSGQDNEGLAEGDMDDFSPLVQQDDDTIDLVVQNTQPQPNLVSNSSPTPVQKRGRGRPRKSEPKAPKVPTPAAKRGRGRPPEELSDYEDERPPKRRRDASTEFSPPPAAKTQLGKKPPPSQRDPNARITSGKRVGGAALTTRIFGQGNTEPETEPEPKRRGRPRNPQNPALKSRGLYITRRETPTEDGALKTRSGRTSVKPCAYWRNERIVYGEGDSKEGEGYLLPTIKEVIRTEEVSPPVRKRRNPVLRAGKKRARSEETESEDDMEPWELDPGIMSGEIEQWDDDTGTTLDIDPVHSSESTSVHWRLPCHPLYPSHTHPPFPSTEIAYSSNAIETVPAPNSTFRYSKVISLDFYGAGIVDLPPGGQKRTKNSQKMQMSFFVHYGRVLVDVAGTQFRIGKGGIWQVPRG
ncbi:MAG: hypothetical protein M1839_009122 [Geoglossum umbratile]|nr:MAG: hypothetical protein M1839_009122 [Geoglossum umbratile]